MKVVGGRVLLWKREDDTFDFIAIGFDINFFIIHKLQESIYLFISIWYCMDEACSRVWRTVIDCARSWFLMLEAVFPNAKPDTDSRLLSSSKRIKVKSRTLCLCVQNTWRMPIMLLMEQLCEILRSLDFNRVRPLSMVWFLSIATSSNMCCQNLYGRP